MLDLVARNWWLLVLRGVLAILFAIAAFIWPGPTVALLITLFGAYAFVDGVFAVASAIQRAGAHQSWWGALVEGILGIVAGILTFVWPGVTALVLATIVGFWAIVTGVSEIIAAVQLRREIDNEWSLGLAGALSVLFGLVLILFPGAGILSLLWLVAVYALLFGVLLIVLGLRLRGLHSGMPTRTV
jgi:uncharacterized membrane protein HdeD (DUF308 family)